MPPKILLVEDEVDLAAIILFHLKREGYEVTHCADGVSADTMLDQQKFDLAIFDWQLPGKLGIDLCKTWSHVVSVIMLTARDHPADIVLGLESGAYDYITKPFDIPVVLARVRAVLRRVTLLQKSTNAGTNITYQNNTITIDHAQHRTWLGSNELNLTPNEFKILSVFFDHQGQVLTRQKLIGAVQGLGFVVSPRAIDTAVYELRKKLGDASGVIETVRGVGYRIRSESQV